MLHFVQVPVIRVFQSVSFSLKRHVVAPPFEIVVHGFFVPGKFATMQPGGTGTRQLCRGSPFSIPKLQDDSVVADESPKGWADASPKRPARMRRDRENRTSSTRRHNMRACYHNVRRQRDAGAWRTFIQSPWLPSNRAMNAL